MWLSFHLFATSMIILCDFSIWLICNSYFNYIYVYSYLPHSSHLYSKIIQHVYGIYIYVCGMSIKPLYHTLGFDLNLAIYLAYKCEERDHAGKLITFFIYTGNTRHGDWPRLKKHAFGNEWQWYKNLDCVSYECRMYGIRMSCEWMWMHFKCSV